MIKHEWKRWQARLWGFGLVCWLAVAPDVVGELWKLCTGYGLSVESRDWLQVSHGLLIAGVIAAVSIWAASDCVRARLASRWFLLGACTVFGGSG